MHTIETKLVLIQTVWLSIKALNVIMMKLGKRYTEKKTEYQNTTLQKNTMQKKVAMEE